MNKKIKDKINDLPDLPGIYVMKSKTGQILYVGKASSLKKRVSTYFRRSLSGAKNIVLVEQVADFNFSVCDTQAQALILEASLIKEKKPKYNIALKDDKSYPYIQISKDSFPCISVTRPKVKTGSFLFGPYTNVRLAKQALRLVRTIFPYRSCKKLPKKSCLYYHLNLCPAPCIKKISLDRYHETIKSIKNILSGDKKNLLNRLEKKMVQYSSQKNFEQAALLRDKLRALYNLYSGRVQLNQLVILKQILNLKKIPLIIEAIDISNLTGKEPAGSVVVFKDGLPDKKNYRRFSIKSVYGPNDYDMIAEVVMRRYSRLKRENLSLPQLIIIDGGKAHVNIAKKALDKLKIDVPVIGIAKRHEEVWMAKSLRPLIIDSGSQALFLIQRLRDEAHRFAHKYHTFLRNKKAFTKSG